MDDPRKTTSLIFVYGTLKQSLSNHSVMENAQGQFLGKGETSEPFPLVETDFPYLLDQKGRGHKVDGEVYRVESLEGWEILDELEGQPSFYRRRTIDVELNGERVQAWAYFLVRNPEGLSELPYLKAYSES
jgi:gamma-glutamylcyclotransferase (GGCT)/AIG2-like uncharacterized protein YtfP